MVAEVSRLEYVPSAVRHSSGCHGGLVGAPRAPSVAVVRRSAVLPGARCAARGLTLGTPRARSVRVTSALLLSSARTDGSEAKCVCDTTQPERTPGRNISHYRTVLITLKSTILYTRTGEEIGHVVS